MPVRFCSIEGGNFGDDLNMLLWPRLFPDLKKLHLKIVVFGIGTLLDGKQDRSLHRVVLGSGLGLRDGAIRDGQWEFRWVRGPLTAQAFGLATESALGDAALLWPELRPRLASACAGRLCTA